MRMIYYDRPKKLAPGLEQKIVDVVTTQLPASFGAEARHRRHRVRFHPRNRCTVSAQSPDLEVQLVVAEPLVQSPVAIDWDARGRLWVCEMFDYPTGLDEKWKPGGPDQGSLGLRRRWPLRQSQRSFSMAYRSPPV